MFSKKRKCFGVRELVFFSLVGFLYPSSVYAQKEVDSTGLKHSLLGEVVVTAPKHKFSTISPMPLQSLSGKELDKLNSFSVADAIRYFSGVQLKDYGGVGGLKTVNVRSLGSAHTAVFYDGMNVGNAQNGQVDLGKFSLDNIEEIQLYNGHKSTIFQPARGFFASNTLFLKSKTPHFDSNKAYHIRTGFKTGSFGLIDPSVLYQQKLSETFSLSASTEWIKGDGKYKYQYKKANGWDTTAVRQNGDIESQRAEVSLFQKLKNGGNASFKAYLYNSERGLPGAIISNRYSHSQRLWDRNIFVHGFFHKPLSDKFEWMANVKYSDDYSRYLDPEFATSTGALDNRYYQKELYASLVNQYSIRPWWNVSLASDFSFNKLDANLPLFSYPTRYSYLGALSSHIQKKRFDIQASILACYIDERVKFNKQGDSQKVFKPVVSASYQPLKAESFRVRAFYKESFRMPTFNDLYYTFVGNSSLRPEYTTQYDVGFTWIYEKQGVLKTISIQGDAYYNKVKDKIVAMPSSNIGRWTILNLGEVEIKGVEINSNLNFQLPYTIRFDLGLSYTYQKAIDITSGFNPAFGHQIAYTPLHSGSAIASLQWEKWQMNYSYLYTGQRYNQKENKPVNYTQPWYTHDLAFNWQGKVLKQQVRLATEINNLLGQYYDVIANFPMPGRSYRFSISITI